MRVQVWIASSSDDGIVDLPVQQELDVEIERPKDWKPKRAPRSPRRKSRFWTALAFNEDGFLCFCCDIGFRGHCSYADLSEAALMNGWKAGLSTARMHNVFQGNIDSIGPYWGEMAQDIFGMRFDFEGAKA